jgi:predicted GIY-YIG superfamily endonuclease
MEKGGAKDGIQRRWQRGGAGAYVLHHASYPQGLIREVDYYIYVLRDPRDGSARYVGRTKDTGRRIQQHLYRKSDGSFIHARREWIQQLRSASLRPQMEVVETLCAPVAEALISERERRWIFHFFQQGASLTNVACIRMPRLYAAARTSSIDFLNEPLDSPFWEELAPLYQADAEEWKRIDRALWEGLEKDPEYHRQTGRELELLWERHLAKKMPDKS